MLKLPTYQELSKEQDTINNLPLSGTHLVVGPPGTGKTVIAIYRAEMCKRAKLSSQFIVYNNTLRQYLDTAIREKDINGQTLTYHSWFGKWYWRNFHKYPPQTERYKYDWQQIHENISRQKNYDVFDHLIIDEGQDFSKEFYLVIRQIAKNVSVFADENQRLNESNSTIDEIKSFLGAPNIHSLSRNYRNSLPIAEFARQFYVGLKTGIPDLPVRIGSKPRLFLKRDFNEQIALIARIANNNPDNSIGVFVKTQDQQKIFLNQLNRKVKGCVQTYMYNDDDHKTIDFCKNGIIILTYKSAKGLEFDNVFLPNLDTLRSDANEYDQKMEFYVLLSRARNELNLMCDGDNIPQFMRFIPDTLYQKV
jgi:DNA helicase IV